MSISRRKSRLLLRSPLSLCCCCVLDGDCCGGGASLVSAVGEGSCCWLFTVPKDFSHVSLLPWPPLLLILRLSL